MAAGTFCDIKELCFTFGLEPAKTGLLPKASRLPPIV